MWQTIIKDLLIIFIIFVPLERLFPIRDNKKTLRRLWGTDFLHATVTTILISMVMAMTLVAVAALIKPIIPLSLRTAIGAQPFWLQFLEIVILADIGYYWAHRAFHTFPILWRFHAIHHSIEDMDALAGHRLHPVDQGLTRGVTLAPILLLNFDTAAFALFAICGHTHFLINHSNIKFPLGPFRWIVASPQFHHWHHANEPRL